MKFTFNQSNISALEAQFEAQKIAFAPVTFQTVRVLREWGILKMLDEHRDGLSIDEIAKRSKKTHYALQTLLESALSASVVESKENKFTLSKIGHFIQNDDMTKVNIDFNHYVNYLGMYYLDDSLEKERPVGLKHFGDWETIYPALSLLPQKVKDSWFNFDHFYSDGAFAQALEVVKKLNPKTVLDIGGNTGKFSLFCAATIPQTNICIVDLPEQIALARECIKTTNMENRISTYPTDILGSDDLPQGYDIVWMSQFLDCFSKKDILFILKKVAKSLKQSSRVCILEPVWDRQKFTTSAYCIINTSLYFTALANGKSKMLKSEDWEELIKEVGLEVESITDNLGAGHSLFVCKKK